MPGTVHSVEDELMLNYDTVKNRRKICRQQERRHPSGNHKRVRIATMRIPSVVTLGLAYAASNCLVTTTDAFTIGAPLLLKHTATTTRPTTSSTSLYSEEDGSPSDSSDDPSDASPSDTGDDEIPTTFTDGPTKTALLSAIASASTTGGSRIVFGSNDDGGKIPDLVKTLKNKYVVPVEKPSEWQLLYTSAPNLLGLLEGGPLSQLESLEQELSKEAMTFTLTYKPPSDGPISSLVGSILGDDISEDRLTQELVFEYEEKTMNDYSLKLQSTQLDSTRFGSLPALNIPAVAPSVEAFKVIFNDGDLRIEKTVQGDFVVIYKRI